MGMKNNLVLLAFPALLNDPHFDSGEFNVSCKGTVRESTVTVILHRPVCVALPLAH